MTLSWRPCGVSACFPYRVISAIHAIHKQRSDGVFLKQAQADSAYRVLYQQCEAARLGSIRFRALYTDGGCDEGLKQYWVSEPDAPSYQNDVGPFDAAAPYPYTLRLLWSLHSLVYRAPTSTSPRVICPVVSSQLLRLRFDS